MFRKFLPVIILATCVALHTSAQRIVQGEVRLKTDSTFVAGVNVVVKHTTEGVVTDGEGKFRVQCTSSNPVLQFSFIGLKTIEVTVTEDYLFVYLELDEEALNEKSIMAMYPEYTAIGLSSGVAYTPVGLNIRNSLPILFGMKMLTATTLTYRTDLDNNNLLDIRIKKEKLINTMYYGRHVNIEFDYGKRAIEKGSSRWNVQEINAISELVIDNILIRLGYGRQSFNDTETLKSNPGLIFGAGGYFNSAQLIATAKKWNGYWQVEAVFLQSLRNNNFEIGLAVETLRGYKELELLLRYRIDY